MAIPAEQLILVDGTGRELEIDRLIEDLRKEPKRVLADDEIGLILYVGDTAIYSLQATDTGGFLAQHVTEISRPRFSKRVLRRQIGATVLSLTADAVFVIKDGNSLKKVRAEKLEPGMVLASGEKVYR